MNRIVAIVLIGGLVGCRNDKGATGRIEVRWTGADTGRLEASAIARWCAADSAVEITGIEADSGAGIALFPADSVAAGEYVVSVPGEARPRPRAAVALRRFGENLVLGYLGVSGTVVVDSGPPLTGSLQATLHELTTGDELNVSGTFSGLTVEPGDVTCGVAAGGNRADTVVR